MFVGVPALQRAAIATLAEQRPFGYFVPIKNPAKSPGSSVRSVAPKDLKLHYVYYRFRIDEVLRPDLGSYPFRSA